MSYVINNQQKVNDVIFANRNKNYGAYVLRADYGYTLMASLFFTALFIGSVMGTAYYFTNHTDLSKPRHDGQIIKNEIIHTIAYQHKLMEELTSPKTKPQSPLPQTKAHKTISNSLVIKDSVPETKQSNTLIQNPAITENTIAGTETTSKPITDNNTGGNAGGGTGDKKIKKDIEVDSPPEFEGGLAALYRIISQNLHYPSEAIAEGRGGTVYINFVVDELGKIDQVSLLNKKGFGLDEEALRVVKLLPSFKTPAKVKGEAVKVYFQLPIKFVLK